MLVFLFHSDSDNDDESAQVDSACISPSTSARRVSFFSKKANNINGTITTASKQSPTSPIPSTPNSVGKMRRRRMRTTSRSGDDRISFRGRNPIYTAGMLKD